MCWDALWSITSIERRFTSYIRRDGEYLFIPFCEEKAKSKSNLLSDENFLKRLQDITMHIQLKFPVSVNYSECILFVLLFVCLLIQCFV